MTLTLQEASDCLIRSVNSGSAHCRPSQSYQGISSVQRGETAWEQREDHGDTRTHVEITQLPQHTLIKLERDPSPRVLSSPFRPKIRVLPARRASPS